MQHKKYLIAGILGILACGCMLAGCTQAAEEGGLPAPSNLTIDEAEYLTWDEVDGAEGYIVAINDKEYETQTNGLDIFCLTVIPQSYTLRVMAYTEFADSAWSPSLTYEASNDFINGVGLKETRDGTGYEIAALKKEFIKGKVVLPSTGPDGRSVVGIAARAFEDCRELTGIVMPDCITKIGVSAFEGCSALARVEFSWGLQEIGSDAFSGCESLKYAQLPEGVETIGSHAFEDCGALERISLPSTLSKLGNRPFEGCAALGQITIAEGNQTYRSEGNCILRNADDALIAGCAGSVIPDGASSVETGAFEDCAGLTELVIPESVISIGYRAFANCTGLRQVTVPGSVKTIGSMAFYGCTQLERLTLEEGIEQIGVVAFGAYAYSAFGNCTALAGVELPASLKELGGDAFTGCSDLSSLTVAEGNPVFYAEGNCVIRKEDGELVAGCPASEIPEGIRSIGARAFANWDRETVTVPDGVQTIGAGAFYASSVKTVRLPEGLKEIGSNAFQACTDLAYIVIPQSVVSIGTLAFGECKYITVMMPGIAETIGGHAFQYATVYTAAEYGQSGWGDRDMSWHEECNIFYSCTFAYEEGVPYLYSVVKEIASVDQELVVKYSPAIYMWNWSIPVREGYIFAGWATEEGGEVKYGVTTVTEKVLTMGQIPITQAKTHEVCFPDKSIDDVPDGTTLYAVWEKI